MKDFCKEPLFANTLLALLLICYKTWQILFLKKSEVAEEKSTVHRLPTSVGNMTDTDIV